MAMLSFIVPAYNEEFELPRSITAIRDAADKAGCDYEIVVVDDGSTDATARIATEQKTTLVQIQRRHIAAARNAGAKAARGEIFFFIDADTRIDRAHIAGAVAALQAGCSGGSARVAVDGTIPIWARIFVRVFSTVYFANNLGAGAFLFTSRANFGAVGGFDERLFIGEEVYFSRGPQKDCPIYTSLHTDSYFRTQAAHVFGRAHPWSLDLDHDERETRGPIPGSSGIVV